MLVIAHRGANKEAFENSWSAFEKAIDAGAHRIELDAQLTSDKELVVLHDDNLQHSCGINANASRLTRKELSQLKLRNGEPVPFIDEVLDRLLDRIELNIEIKPTVPLAAQRLWEYLKGRRFEERVIVSSFRMAPLAYLADHHPEVKRACLWGDVFSWQEASYFAPINFMNRCRTRIFHPWTGYLTPSVMEQARARNWIVYPWVGMKGEDVDREVLWSYLDNLGVDGLCTNYPREFKGWLEDNRK